MKPVIWLMGLSASGKTTLASYLCEYLKSKNITAVHLDGDNVRKGLNIDLGYSKEDRYENIRRITEIAKLLSSQDIVVVCSFITPYNKLRSLITRIIGSNLYLFYLKCSLDECVKRDPKGLYKKLPTSMTGVCDLFEAPKIVNLIIDTESNDLIECANKLKKEVDTILANIY